MKTTDDFGKWPVVWVMALMLVTLWFLWQIGNVL